MYPQITSHEIAESGALSEDTMLWFRSVSFEFGLRYGVGILYRVLGALIRVWK